jgi:small subunit ribosomal protein S1
MVVVIAMEQDSPQTGASAAMEVTVLGTAGQFSWVDLGEDCLGIIATPELGALQPNERVRVFVRGTDPDAICLVSRSASSGPMGWPELRELHKSKAVIAGTVEGRVRGGLRVSLGAPVIAFLPNSRSGAMDYEMDSLIGRTILCTIVEVDETDQNIVVDRWEILAAADALSASCAIQKLKVGARLRGTISSLTDFGAFVDIGGVEGLLHARDISWRYIERPSDVLHVGQEIEVLIDRLEPERGRVSLSMKALEPDPWVGVEQRFKPGDKVVGKITTITSFGAFVELAPGVEGLVHQSDLSWSKKQLKPSDLLAPGHSDEFVILSVDASQRRIALSRKRAVEDPWADLNTQFPVGSVAKGTISSLTDFGAFVRLTDDIEGLIHVADISEGRIGRPADVLALGQSVRACVLEVDGARRRLRLGLKQVKAATVSVEPTGTVSGHAVSPAPVPLAANYAAYSSTIFVNIPPSEAVFDAIVFAVLDAGFLPRVRLNSDSVTELFSIVRESQFAIHEISQPFEAGLFIGCKEYGSDLHRAKEALFLSPTGGRLSPEIEVCAHRNDATEAIRCVISWLAQTIGRSLVWREVASRYAQYVSDASIRNTSGAALEKPPLTERIRLLREWVGSARLANSPSSRS